MIRSDKEFKRITGKRLHNLSQLQKFEIWEDEGEYFFNIFDSYNIIDEIKNDDDYVFYYYVEEDDWWDNIAYKFYENERLWWIIALTNDVINPFEELISASKIKIIDKRWLYKIVKDLKRTTR